ncbi:threonylcarbamoyl-AMP synthase [bacterium]|nr:threonylcarbamoyl-AMP synthase [bacterium]
MNYNKSELNEILNNGGVIAFVTDTVWGVGCLPNSQQAVKKIYEIKGRDTSKPLILMSNKIEYLKSYVKEFPPTAINLISRFFPGALTLVLAKSDKTPDYITSNFDTVGIRIPNNKTFQQICEDITGHVLATTSANLSGQPSAKTYDEAKEFIGNFVDLVVTDREEYAQGLESTVVLVTNTSVKVLRQGAVKIMA